MGKENGDPNWLVLAAISNYSNSVSVIGLRKA
jgi:hypothetical protein